MGTPGTEAQRPVDKTRVTHKKPMGQEWTYRTWRAPRGRLLSGRRSHEQDAHVRVQDNTRQTEDQQFVGVAVGRGGRGSTEDTAGQWGASVGCMSTLTEGTTPRVSRVD